MANRTASTSRRKRQKCIFCESDRKITKEHVFGQWLREYFPRDKNSKRKSAYISWNDELRPALGIDVRKIAQGHPGSMTLRVVCRDCNVGWMSQLENQVRRAMKPLILGNRCNILGSGQRLLAAWAAKTAMVAENFAPVDSGVTQAERTWLMESQMPPDKWFVWIAAYNGEDWANLGILQSRAGLSPTPVARPSDAPYYAEATTFGVGRILFSVVSGSEPNMEKYFAGRETDSLIQIWPLQPRSILWPPLRIFGDKEANQVASIFSLSGVFDNSFDPGANWQFSF